MPDSNRPVPPPREGPSGEDASPVVRRERSEDSLGDTRVAGQTVDDGRGRVFPCEQCGADLAFHIGQQRLKCPYCGFEKDLARRDGAEVREQDFHSMLERLKQLRPQEPQEDSGIHEVKCRSCGGTVVFTGTLTSRDCPYCGSPIQREHVHSATQRIAVDGVLPFLVDHHTAAARLKEWVSSRWFAPNEFLRRGIEGKFNGVYLPYWTYDTLTYNVFSGERGEDYWVTVGSGDKKRRVRKTRWHSASGDFQRFFDDVLVIASQGLPRDSMLALEPWPLAKCLPFTQEVLAGFFARTYDVPLEDGFREARARIDAAVETETRQRIGGDRQRIHSLTSRYDALTFKHLLLPVWMLAYRHSGKPFRIFVNAGTGEVQGERPYSWVKITFAVLGAAILAIVIGLLFGQR